MKLIVSVAGEQIGVASLGQPGRYCVGRHAGSSLHLSHPTVSAQHATVFWDGEQAVVWDGTGGARSWLDGETISGRTCWEPGQTLRLGAVAIELRSEPPGEGLCSVGLTPTRGALEADPTLPETMTHRVLPAPITGRPAWERKLAASAASAAAVAAAWIALFW